MVVGGTHHFRKPQPIDSDTPSQIQVQSPQVHDVLCSADDKHLYLVRGPPWLKTWLPQYRQLGNFFPFFGI